MNCEEVKLNLPEYIDGKLDKSATEAIREHLESCASCRTEQEELKSFLGYLDTFNDPELPAGMKDEFLALVSEQENQKKQKTRVIPMWTKIAAAVVLFFGTYWIGYRVGTGQGKAETSQLASELHQQKQEVVLASLRDYTGPQKIEAVYNISNSGKATDDLVNALVYTMNSDKNVNVRLAAITALSGMMKKNPLVKTELIKSLSLQENPLLQISLIQVLTESGVKEAKDEIESIARSPKTDESVKTFAKDMVKTII